MVFGTDIDMKTKSLPFLSALVGAVLLTRAAESPAASNSPDPYANETAAERDARMKWWREARFGMFIHWGVYSVPAGTYDGKRIGGIGEWIMCTGKIPMARYQEYAKQFDPEKFNAEDWVRTAKAAGMKYIVITSKHHDGFAMFDSKASDWNIVKATPFKRDPLKELAAACRKEGLRLGFYYSQAQDWNNGGSECSGLWDPAQKHDMDDYIDKVAVPQVKEILTDYGPGIPAVLWWDTPCDMNPERAAKLIGLLKLKPGIIHNNRLGGGFPGDTETPEQEIPATGFKGRDWETCMTMNDTWGYKSYDHDWKPTETLVRNLVDIASKGGNYLLNVGPTSEGLIPAPSIERLKEVGAWMQMNGEAIYASSASPFKKLAWGRCTQKPGKLYLHVFDWPADGRLRVPLASAVTRAYLLADKSQALQVASDAEGKIVSLPSASPTPYAGVVVLEIAGQPELTAVATPRIRPAADGSLTLKAGEAELMGDGIRVERRGGEDNVGFWTNPKDYVQWPATIAKAGAYEVVATFACAPGADGSRLQLRIGDQSWTGPEIPATQGWEDFVTETAGTIEVQKAGPVNVELKVVEMPHGAVANLRSLVLRPVN